MHCSPISLRSLRWPVLLTVAMALPLPGSGTLQSEAQAQTVNRLTAAKTGHPAVTQKVKTKKPLPAPWSNSVKGLEKHIKQIEAQAQKARAKRDKAAHNKRAEQEAEAKARLRPEPRKEEEEAGTDYLEAYLYYLKQRAYPRDGIDWSAYPRAVAQRDRMPAAHIGAEGDHEAFLSGTWQFVGPHNLAIPYQIYYGNGPLSGRVNAFVFDPVAAGTYYLASMGGVWKTTDSGMNWTPLSDAWPDLKTSSLAIDPTNHNTVYAGTGDYDGSLGYPFGIMKTTDGGATWTNYGKADFGGASVSAIVVDPETPSIVTLATGRGIYSDQHFVWRSANGGVSWTKVIDTDTNWSDLKIGAKNSSGLRYYYTVGDGGNIWRSADRGATWTQLSTTAFPATPDQMEIAPSPLDVNTVYLLDTANKMLFKSTDAGVNWTDITAGFSGDSTPGDNYNWSQNTYDRALVCSSQTVGGNTTDVLYASLIDMDQYYYDNASATWKWRSVGQAYTSSSVLHNDQHALTVSPFNPNTLLVGCDGGAYRFTYDPNAGTWNFDSLNAGLGLTQYYKAAFHPADPTRMIGGAQDNGSPTSLGDLSNFKNFGGGDGGFSAIHPVTPDTQYTTSQKLAVYVTTDNWMTNTEIDPPFGMEHPAFIAPIFLDKKTPQYLYGGTDYLYRYDQTAGTWSSHVGGTALASSGEYISYITVAPGDSNRIYTGSSAGEVYMSTNFGATFTQINMGTPALPNRAITYLAVDPNNPSRLFVTVGGSGSGHVFVCPNTTAGARVWLDISGAGVTGLPDINTNAIALDVDNPTTTYYIGNDVGVFMTTDAGATWTNATSPMGLPNVQVNDLSCVAGQRALYAATFGRGIWKISLGSSTRSVSGMLTFEGIAPTAAAQNVTFVFRPVGGGTNITQTALVPASGVFALTGVPSGNYNLWIKGSKYLAQVVPVNTTSGNVTGVTSLQHAGDADNSNAVDVADFGILINAYSGVAGVPGSNYDIKADFNGDGFVDVADFALMVNNYSSLGAP